MIRSFNEVDIEISKLIGLETYKALYYYWPDLYSYISDPLVPTKYYVNLMANTVNNSGYNFTQTSSSLQPKIVDSGVLLTKNSKPTILFNGSSNYMNVPFSQNYFGFLHKTGQSFVSIVGYSTIQKTTYLLCNNNGTSAQFGYSLSKISL